MKRTSILTIAGLVILVTIFIFFGFQASAQTINTGNASSTTVVGNQVNTNDVKICNDCTPTPVPSQDPSSTPVPEDTPTPTDKPGDNGNGGSGGNGGDGGSNQVGGAQGSAQAAPAVLGLATTSGENQTGKLLGIISSFAFLGLGYRFLHKNA